MVTPFLNTLNTNGGTLYTFSSASRDLTRIFTDYRFDFSFSHFACLNLPNVRSINGNKNNIDTLISGLEKGMYLERFNLQNNQHTSEVSGGQSADDMNALLAENLQNYVMNFETAILNNYNNVDGNGNVILHTVAERIFFKWLQKIHAIEFDTDVDEGTIRNYYYESGDSVDEHVVKYINVIDGINSADIFGDTYNEVYLYIPSGDGATKNVKFKTSSDMNYSPNKRKLRVTNSYNNENVEEYIIGRTGIEHPYNLSLKPFYDDDDNNSYEFDEGFGIDFDDSNYSDGISGTNSKSQSSFEFNCVLIYYTMKEKDNPENSAINLYGVLFLDQIKDLRTYAQGTDSAGTNNGDEQGYIQRYPKIKGNDSGNGNSFALKVDMKIDTLPDSSFYDKSHIIEEDSDGYTYQGVNSTLTAMELYHHALYQMNKCVEKILKQKETIRDLENRVEYLENRLDLVNDIPRILGRIDDIDDRISYSDTIIDGQSLKDLIDMNSKSINSIIEGRLTTKLQYNTDVIKEGTGIEIVRNSDNNEIVINSPSSLYNVTGLYKDIECNNEITRIESGDETSSGRYDFVSDEKNKTNSVYIELTNNISYSNLGIFYFENECNNNLVFYIKGGTNWRKGQSLKIIFDGNLKVINGCKNAPTINIIFLGEDDSEKELTTPLYPVYISEHENLGYIEIICINSDDTEVRNKFIYEIR